MAAVLFENVALFDGESPELREPSFVLVEGDRIREVSDQPIRQSGAERVDGRGKTLMPGMIDCHVHVYVHSVRLGAADRPPTYYAHYAATFLRDVLACGFTTVRDVAGGDHGLAMALDAGLDRRAAVLLRGTRAVADRRSRRFPRSRRAGARLLHVRRRAQRARDPRRRRRRLHQGGARRAAQGRAPHQDHGLGRDHESERPDRSLPVLGRRDPRHRRRVPASRRLRRRALPPRRGGAAIGAARRAHHRARHADHRRHGARGASSAARSWCRRSR